jgi:hypothetical protein
MATISCTSLRILFLWLLHSNIVGKTYGFSLGNSKTNNVNSVLSQPIHFSSSSTAIYMSDEIAQESPEGMLCVAMENIYFELFL